MISPMCPRCDARRIVVLSATLLLARRLGFTRMRAPASARRRHVVTPSAITRRTLMKGGGAALAGMSVLRIVGPTLAFQTPVTGEVRYLAGSARGESGAGGDRPATRLGAAG